LTTPVEPYVALAVQNTVHGIRNPDDIHRNIDQILQNVQAAVWLSSLEYPVKLISLAEGALTGFTDEVLDYDHVRAARDVYIEIPGEITERLGKEICRRFDTYLIGQSKARDTELWPDEDRFFNLAFIIDPNGDVIHKHRKTSVFQREHSTCPHDIWERIKEFYGDDPEALLQAIYPVTKTGIGNIATAICMEGSYPEIGRAFAINGAEIMYRPSYPEPWVSGSAQTFSVQNRAHAVNNTMYVLAPNVGNYYPVPWETGTEISPVNVTGGNSMIIDYQGRVIHNFPSTDDGYAAAAIHIEELRKFRAQSKMTNYLKDIRVEQYKLIYEAAERKGGIFPKNLWMDQPPRKHADMDQIFAYVKNHLMQTGMWTPPTDWQPEDIDDEIVKLIEDARRRYERN